MISAAFFWPMPWMYWSAIRTRLLVGIFTPAIRAKDFSPVAGIQTGQFIAISGGYPQTRTRRPSPRQSRGPASFENYPNWIGALLKYSTWFRQPSLRFSPLFRALFESFFGFSGHPGPGPGGSLARCLFCLPGGRFRDLPGGSGSFSSALGPIFALAAGRFRGLLPRAPFGSS